MRLVRHDDLKDKDDFFGSSRSQERERETFRLETLEFLMRTKSAFTSTKRTEEDDIFETHVLLLYYLCKVRHAYVCVVIQRGHT